MSADVDGSSRARILQAAEEIAAERGYLGTTISAVCERSQLPVSSLYWFFKDKDELLSEVVRASFEQWRVLQPEWELPAPGADPATALYAVVRRSHRGLLVEPAFLRIGQMLLLESLDSEPPARVEFERIRLATVAQMTTWFAHLLDDGLVSRDPGLPEELAQVVEVMADGLFLAAQAGDDVDADDYARRVVGVVMTELAARSAAP